MTVAPAKLVTRREGTREVPPSRKREELTGRALKGYWLLATGSRYSMSFVQTRLSSSSFCLYTKLDSLVAPVLFTPIATSPLHLHFHHCTALHFTSLHCTSPCCNIFTACATIIPTDIQTISSISDGPPTTDSTTGLRAIPAPRSALREQLRFRRYRPAPRGTSCDPGSCIFDNHRARTIALHSTL